MPCYALSGHFINTVDWQTETHGTYIIVYLLRTSLASWYLWIIILWLCDCQTHSLNFPPPPPQWIAKRPKQKTLLGQCLVAFCLRQMSPSPTPWRWDLALWCFYYPASGPEGAGETSWGGGRAILFSNHLCIQHMKTQQNHHMELSFKYVIRHSMSLRRNRLAMQRFLTTERE